MIKFRQSDSIPEPIDTSEKPLSDLVNGPAPKRNRKKKEAELTISTSTDSVSFDVSPEQPTSSWIDPDPAAEESTDDLEATPEFQAALDEWYKDILKWEDACRKSDLDHRIELLRLKDEMVSLDKRVEEQQQFLKALKADRKDTLDTLMTMEKDGPQHPDKPKRPVAKKTKAADGTVTTVKIFKPEENWDESWRKIPTSKVLTDDIEGLGAKKRETILDQYPTLGELMDVLIEAGKQHKHFSELLPTGIGVALAERINDAMYLVINKQPVIES
jgi:hypothetical protein